MRSSTLVVYDLNEKRWLGKSWALYAATFPGSCGVNSWAEVKALVRERGPGLDLQVWGHGSPGRPYIGSHAADPHWDMWSRCDSVWFRSCSVANGAIGRTFMTGVAEHTSVAAHLGIIGPWVMHSRLVAMLHGWDDTWWSPSEVSPNEPSAPWKPRTVTALQRSLPNWAFHPSQAHG